MARRKQEEDKVLDVNASMQGSLVFSDPVNLRINGSFRGSLNTKGVLTIGENANVNADIEGEEIVISGTVQGKIFALKRLVLTRTAMVESDIKTPKIAIEEGAVFNGKCLMTAEKISLEELSDYLDIDEDKIMEWVEEGKIPAEKKDNAFIFDKKQVESWLSQAK